MIATFLILASVTFIAMMSPGPDMMMVIKYGSTKNHRSAITCIAGICCGVSVHVALSILGLAAIIAASAKLFAAMKLIGAGYLIYIGIKSFLSSGGLVLDKSNNSKANKRNTPFRDGLLCNVLNPKVTMFILAVFTQIIEPTTPVFEKIIYGAFIAIQAFVVWNIFVLFIRTKPVLGLLNKFQVAIDRTVGVALVGFGVALALDE